MTSDRRSVFATRAVALVAWLALAACRQAPARSAPTPPPAGQATSVADSGRADVRFLQDMLAHHAQALVMAALVPARTGRQDLRLLAERIDVSQQDEMTMMRRLLRARGAAEAPADHAQHSAAQHQSATPMPGMLTEAELTALREARGAGFDRLFLESMIRHHEGALVMVRRLLDARGGTADPEIYRLAADVDADQRAEIARMRALLGGAR
jgi:uncharacterized protein (DUF305 family)